MATTTDFNIYADFNQFVVCSEGADWSELSEKWSPTAIEEMIVCGAYGDAGHAERSLVARFLTFVSSFHAAEVSRARVM
jgi:hypothetical protein